MNLTRTKLLLSFAAALLFSSGPVLAVDANDFKQAINEAQQEFGTDDGHNYAAAFAQVVAQNISDAMQACHTSDFKPEAKCDVVFTVSTDGRIIKTIAEPGNAYGACILSHLKMPDNVPRPPGGGWPVQVRLENAPRQTGNPNTPFITLWFGS